MNWYKLLYAFILSMGIVFLCTGLLADFNSETKSFFNWKSCISDCLGIICIFSSVDILTKKIIKK